MDDNRPFSHSADPHGAKANFDVNEQKLHNEGPPGFIRQVTNLLIVSGVLAAIFMLVLWLR
ncbi:hypothetical protein J2Z69_000795 [Paenibacillus shirakamiensis]|uniref:Uncharacterized protein n=1 Tax=Paenibacillus shirakamiensis TaxID=1265935 RepID=A0ABS4JDI6_9BACL|nr:hypothetical protein [Paenibacillus shirakamiensis]MBP1999776.1 hypothetical protein [Paenibacillus shirakamiensis]